MNTRPKIAQTQTPRIASASSTVAVALLLAALVTGGAVIAPSTAQAADYSYSRICFAIDPQSKVRVSIRKWWNRGPDTVVWESKPDLRRNQSSPTQCVELDRFEWANGQRLSVWFQSPRQAPRRCSNDSFLLYEKGGERTMTYNLTSGNYGAVSGGNARARVDCHAAADG